MHKYANKFRIRIKKKSTQNFRNEQKRKKKQRIAGVSERVRKSDIHGETARAETGLFARRRVHTKGNSLRGSPCIFLPSPDDAVHEVQTARCSSGSCLAARYSHFYDGKGTLGRNNWANRCYSNRITRRIYIYDSADSLYLRGIFLRNFDYALLPRFGSDARTLHPRFDCGESIFHAHRPLRNDRKRDIT